MMTLFCRHIQGPSPRPEALLLLVAVFVRCHTHFYHHRKELLEVNCIVTIDVQFSEQVFDIYILSRRMGGGEFRLYQRKVSEDYLWISIG